MSSKYIMKKEEIYYSINETARKLGLSRDILLTELHEGKIEGHLRGKRIKFRQLDIDKYVEKQRINYSARAAYYEPKHLRKMKLY